MPNQNQKPAGTGSRPEPPGLVFRPDTRRAARVAAVRRILLWTTLVVLGVAIVLLFRYRPGPLRAARPRVRPPAAGATAPTATEPGLAVRSTESGSSALVPARQEVGRIRAATDRAPRQWLRAGAALPAEEITTDNAATILERLLATLVLLDSAGADLAEARAANRRLVELSRRLESSAAYSLSSFCAKAGRYLELLEDEARDQSALFESLTASCRAALDGNPGEASIKQDVANSFRRKSEARQKAMRRRKSEFDEAVRRYLE